MTQTLMTFMKLVSPPARLVKSAAVNEAAAVMTPLERARSQYESRLDRLNRRISRLVPGGRLVGVPLCPSACVPGDLAEFVLSLGTDPFRRWNIVLYADGGKTARALRTIPYHPDYERAVDPIMSDYLVQLRQTRADRHNRKGPMDAAALAALNSRLRDKLFADCARIESTLFDAQERQWRLYARTEIAPGVPPNAAISADISSGIAAENRI